MIANNNHRPSLAERIAARVVVDPVTGCWLWTGCRDRAGYGQISVGGTMKYAHRVALELANGPIPDGHCVCHRCDRPACLNVDHLFVGTNDDNMADRDAKSRQARGETNGRSKLTDAEVVAIRVAVASGESRTSVADRFSVSRQVAAEIACGRRWPHVGGPITPARRPRGGGNKARGDAHGSARITTDNVLEIRRRLASGESRGSLARAFGVCRTTVSGIASGRSWRHVPDVVVVAITATASPTVTAEAVPEIAPPTVEEIRRELAGRTLVCWCKPAACHGDTLAEIADATNTAATSAAAHQETI